MPRFLIPTPAQIEVWKKVYSEATLNSAKDHHQAFADELGITRNEAKQLAYRVMYFNPVEVKDTDWGKEYHKLTADLVEALFQDCLFENFQKGDEPKTRYVEGLLLTAHFDPEKVKGLEATIRGLLEQLPNEFLAKQDGGLGGWTFLNMVANKELLVWGTQAHAQQLLMLAIAAGYGRFCEQDRRKWVFLPGHVPFFEWSPTKFKPLH